MRDKVLGLIDNQIGIIGDDAYRAAAAFKGLTPEQMEEEHGHSGKSRKEILAGYRGALSELVAAKEWFLSATEGK